MSLSPTMTLRLPQICSNIGIAGVVDCVGSAWPQPALRDSGLEWLRRDANHVDALRQVFPSSSPAAASDQVTGTVKPRKSNDLATGTLLTLGLASQ